MKKTYTKPSIDVVPISIEYNICSGGSNGINGEQIYWDDDIDPHGGR